MHDYFRPVLIFTAMLGIALSNDRDAIAGRILYVDASAPGNNPTTTWEDLSGQNSDFTAVGGVVHNGGTQSYSFNGTDAGFLGSNESLYDFDTEKAGVAQGTPFSVVLYYKNVGGATGSSGQAAVQKGDLNAFPNTAAWAIAPRQDGDGGANANSVDAVLQGPNNRLYQREKPLPGSPNTDFHLLAVTFDGSGDSSGTQLFFDGVSLGTPDTTIQSNLAQSIQNDSPIILALATGAQSTDFWKGEIGFLEVWNEVLSPLAIVERWNDGSPLRAVPIPEPSSMILAICGVFGAGLLRRSRR